MRFRQIAPRPRLREAVRAIWTLSGAEPAAGGDAPQPVPPDGCVEIVLSFADRAERVEPGRAPERQPRSLLVGELFRPVCVRLSGRVDLVGVRFAPGHGAAFLEVGGLGEIIDRTAALDEVCRPELRAALAAVFGIEPGAERIQRLEDGLEACLDAAAPRGADVAAALAVLERGGGRLGVESLAGRIGLSSRQLERRFVAAAGATPKPFAQVFRFQHALRRIAARAASFADVAAACGYFDQAHLIRDFRRYTSLSPRAYLGAAHPLADHLSA